MTVPSSTGKPGKAVPGVLQQPQLSPAIQPPVSPAAAPGVKSEFVMHDISHAPMEGAHCVRRWTATAAIPALDRRVGVLGRVLGEFFPNSDLGARQLAALEIAQNVRLESAFFQMLSKQFPDQLAQITQAMAELDLSLQNNFDGTSSMSILQGLGNALKLT